MRTYKRTLGSRPYRKYTEETLNKAVQMILSKQISLREASRRFNIHRNTLLLKTKAAREGKPSKQPGRPPAFTGHEEAAFVTYAVAVSSFGFPMTTFDLRCAAKSYLDRTGQRIAYFENGNLPGKDWALTFMRRHKDEISQRMSKNITYARASINAEVLEMFFTHLEKELEGIPTSNIWNYGETNLMDDPGSKKVITRRGAKYPQQIQNSSKANTSIMTCGNADGRLLPIYVNYKAEKLSTTWTENGPPGARYNRTKSGWFDHRVFEDWFVSLMLPVLKRQDGKKLLLGDNLSSHINLHILQLCEENDVKFIALPPNATHLLQPLDVAYFRPMKSTWRKVLTEWKKTTSGSRCTNVPKDEFPGLLSTLMTELSRDGEQNLKSAFRKTGISPLNKDEVIGQLPQAVLEESFIFNSDDFVVVNFEGALYPGKVTEVKPEGYMVSAMQKTKLHWKWPAQDDAILYVKEDVLYKIDPPEPVGKRGLFRVKDLN